MPTTAQPPQPGAGLALNADGVTFDINPADSTVDVTSGLKVGTITDTNVAVANKDGTAATPSLRTLGTTTTQAAPGSGTGAGAAQGDHFVTTATDADLTASTVIPGLAGSADIKSAAGAGTSEEYDTSTTGLTWTSNPTTVDSNTTIASHLYVKDTTAASLYGTKSWSPAGAFDLRAKILLGSDQAASSYDAGLYVADASLANGALMLLTENGSQVFTIGAYTEAASAFTQRGALWSINRNEVYFRIVRDGSNNISFFWSVNGILWAFVATQALTFTAGKVGFRISSGSVVAHYIAVDWLRTNV